MITRILALVLLASSPALASELEVPLGARTALKSKQPITQVVVRDPSLVTVVDTDGVVSLEGQKSGVTAVTLTYADGELERKLVVVGEGINSKSMSAEQAQTVNLEQSAKAQAKVVTPKAKARAL